MDSLPEQFLEQYRTLLTFSKEHNKCNNKFNPAETQQQLTNLYLAVDS